MMKAAIGKVVAGTDLSEAEMIGVMETIMGGEATQAQIGAFITALRIKGETVAEITGAARVMRAKVTRVQAVGEDEILVDTCGTGGDASGTFNVSTTTAFVVAAAGVPVAKRSARFRCVIALAYPGGKCLTAQGSVEGAITCRPRGDGGFGYDPVFEVKALGKTFAELGPEEKNSVSHRAAALRAMFELLSGEA